MLLHKYMKTEDLEFLTDVLNKAGWLFYGELDNILPYFLKNMFRFEFRDYGFGKVEMTDEFEAQYWLVLSELVRINLAEYGTSPRGAWLTPDGERFKKIILENPDWLEQHDKQYK